jgi:hypothetical protein
MLRLNEVNKSGQIFDIAWISPCGTEVLMVDSTTGSVERWKLTRKGDKRGSCGCALM